MGTRHPSLECDSLEDEWYVLSSDSLGSVERPGTLVTLVLIPSFPRIILLGRDWVLKAVHIGEWGFVEEEEAFTGGTRGKIG